MKWTHTTALISCFGLIGFGAVWSGCSGGDNNSNDGGTDGTTGNDSGGNDSGGNDSGNKDSGGDGGGGVDGSVLDCNYYCSNIGTVCTGNDNQYKDQTTCLDMCKTLPNDAGAGATSGDSLACRMYHLSVAAQAGNAATHCPHAGPYGFGTCGATCDDFCARFFSPLGPCSADTTAWANIDACKTACKTGTVPGGDAGAGAPGNAASTGMACREYHLENAYSLPDAGPNPGGHCDHAGLTGGGVCN